MFAKQSALYSTLLLTLLLGTTHDAVAQLREMDRALISAAARGDVAEASRLIAAGGNVNAQDENKDSAYLVAGARGHTDVLRLTLAHGADLKSTNRYGGTALIPACHYGHVDTVRELLKTKIDVNHVNNLGWTALLEAILLGDGGAGHTEIVRLLVSHGANPTLADRDGITPLQHARRRGYATIASILERAGAR
jgi:ankyrin repeat protein